MKSMSEMQFPYRKDKHKSNVGANRGRPVNLDKDTAFPEIAKHIENNSDDQFIRTDLVKQIDEKTTGNNIRNARSVLCLYFVANTHLNLY